MPCGQRSLLHLPRSAPNAAGAPLRLRQRSLIQRSPNEPAAPLRLAQRSTHSIVPPPPSTAAPNALRAKVANGAKQSAQRGITGARKSSLAGPPLDSSPPPGRPHPTARNKVTHLISTPQGGLTKGGPYAPFTPPQKTLRRLK